MKGPSGRPNRAPPRACAFVAFCLLGAFGVAYAAVTAARARVAVLAPAEASPAMRESVTRLCAELTSAGFDVQRLEAPEGVEARAALDRVRPDPPPVAAFVLVPVRTAPTDAAVDVWVTDRLTGKTSVRRIEADPTTGELAPAALAIRAVELLQASLVELRTGGPARAAPTDAPLPAAVERLVEPVEAAPVRHPAFGRGVTLAGGVLASFDGLGVAPTPVVRLTGSVASRLAVRLTLAVPGLAQSEQAALGSANVRQDVALLTCAYALSPTDRRLVPLVFGGGGVYHLDVRGSSASDEFAGASADVWSFAASAGVGLAARVAKRMAIVAETEVMMSLPAAELSIGGAVVGRAGRPSLLASLGVAWTF